MIQREDTSNTLGTTSIDRSTTLREADLRTRLRAFPRDAQSWFLLGTYLRSVGLLNEAEDALRKAISINSGPIHFWEELTRILMDMGRLEEAYQLYDSGKRTASPSVKKELEKMRLLELKIKDVDETSPCISCKDYSYYGCSKGGTCDSILQWRMKIRKVTVDQNHG
ncbi:hypothetical protein EU527_03990 [Candidatus Thorarchaeota archaeon]|nr:MAG: hypothetical protein EU527_03990 [Candidatus Thorarchaeota archaeon]